jgi:hypothetical protein
MTRRALSDLAVEDLAEHPVWEMIETPASSDVQVRPVKQVPVRTLKNRLVGTRLRLADGTRVWALLGNISPGNPRSTNHFLTASVHHQGKWFDLARYHDVDFARRDGKALAAFLGKAPHEVFPIQYDIRDFVVGSGASLAGQIDSAPAERLTQDDLIRLSLQED